MEDPDCGQWALGQEFVEASPPDTRLDDLASGNLTIAQLDAL
jgi:hypothetical protein